MITIALEGIGGSGKSTAIRQLEERLSAQGIRVETRKVGGLGESPREQQLKRVMVSRERLLAAGGASSKQRRDKEQDRIFRLAIRCQAYRLSASFAAPAPEILLLDRTPLMSWVYSAARDPSNPYLPEIWEEARGVCTSLRLDHIVLLDVTPTTAFARLIARVAVETGKTPEEVCNEARVEGMDKASREAVLEKSLHLISEGTVGGKPFVPWDYVPWNIMVRESQLYRQICSDPKLSPVPATIIDGEGSVPRIVSEIEERIVYIK